MTNKLVRKTLDKTLGVPMRTLVRNCIVHPLIRMNYKVYVSGGEDALSCADGAIVVANHISRIDAVMLMSEAWPYARLWPTAWWAEYNHWLQKPLMFLFATVPLGSSSKLPIEMRRAFKE